MIKLHHLNASRSQRLVWLLEELEAPYEIAHYQRDSKTNLAPPSLLGIHPMGKSPILEDAGKVIAETGAIAEYLLIKHDTQYKLHPAPNAENLGQYLEWLHAAEGAPFLPNLFGFYLRRIGDTDSPLAQMMRAESQKSNDHIENHLKQNAYFAGELFSAADCLMGFNIQNLKLAGELESRPSTGAWLEKVCARPAYKQMLSVGI